MSSVSRWVALALALTAVSASVAQAECPAEQRGAEAVLNAVLNYDAQGLTRLLDTSGLATRVMRDLPANDPLRDGLPAALAANASDMANGLLQSLKNSGMQVVRQANAPAGKTLLRKQGAEIGSGVDYIEFELSPAGCVVDWTSLMMGSSASAAMRQNIVLMRMDDGLIGQLFGLQRIDRAQLEKTRTLAAAMVKGDRETALQALAGMKELAKSSYELSMLRVGLLAFSPDAPEYRQALSDLAERFGDDPRTQFILVDHYYFIEDYARGLRAVERMQRQVGKDEENQLLVAGLLKLLGRTQQATEALQSLVALAPERTETHVELVAYLAETGQHEAAVASLRKAADLGIHFEEAAMRQEPVFQSLLASTEYAAFKAEQGE
ncbi:hypothetical protein [Pseudomarimonas arenosa]|uniref:Tetratricopeptide repeat protein n=1 Tax=Pseudomarimonas arenosa TaxID=2774145 RepID=A0AAW3ZKF3_9GAMM|nr:hypothetical protein [Pseudomarimonas arenosa]MBD8525657.1 hypothetical protein [Pseudomarimonas arenosa]